MGARRERERASESKAILCCVLPAFLCDATAAAFAAIKYLKPASGPIWLLSLSLLLGYLACPKRLGPLLAVIVAAVAASARFLFLSLSHSRSVIQRLSSVLAGSFVFSLSHCRTILSACRFYCFLIWSSVVLLSVRSRRSSVCIHVCCIAVQDRHFASSHLATARLDHLPITVA